MHWPIDVQSDRAPGAVPNSRARARLELERSIATVHGFACFADYFADRRRRGWGIDRLARETGQTREWVRGVMRRYRVPRTDPASGASAG